MANMKPGDYFLGIIEFFAILLPGGALVYLIQPWALGCIPPRLVPDDGAKGWAVFLLVAYVVGHLLDALGGWLGELVFRHRSKFCPKRTSHPLITQERSLAKTVEEKVGSESDGTTTFDWCLSFVRLHNGSAADEIDRYQANSKFLRNLALVLLVACIEAVALRAWGAGGVSLFGVFLSAFRYCQLRHETERRVYEYYLLITKDAHAKADR